jgi:hypothetical protein
MSTSDFCKHLEPRSWYTCLSLDTAYSISMVCVLSLSQMLVPDVISLNPYVGCPNIPSVAIQMMFILNAAPETVYLPELWQAHDEPCLALVPNARSKHVHLHWKIQNHMQNVINNWIFNKTAAYKLPTVRTPPSCQVV